MAHMLKMSDEDEWLYPQSSLGDVIDRVLALGPAVAAITRGGDGALLATAEHRFAALGLPVTVADAIGAGDPSTRGRSGARVRQSRLSHGRGCSLTRGIPISGARMTLETKMSSHQPHAPIAFEQDAANPCSQLVSSRYEHASLILTSNSSVTGTQNLYLTFSGGSGNLMNLDWWTFS